MSLPNIQTISTRSKISIAGVGILSIALLLTLTLAQTRQETRSKAATGNTVTMGTATIGTAMDTGDNNTMMCTQYTAPISGNLTSMNVYVGTVDPYKKAYSMALYSDTNNVPGTRIATTADGTLTGSSWNSLPISGSVTSGSKYWICYNTNTSDNTKNNLSMQSGTAKSVYKFQTYGTWPSSFGTPNSSWTSDVFSMYATVAVQSAATTALSSGTQKLVQQNFLSRGGTSKSVSLPASVTAGNLLVVPITYYMGTITGIYDTRGNVYMPVTSRRCSTSSTDCVQLYYVKNAIAGATTVTVTFSEYTDNNVGIYEYQGYDKVAPLDTVTASGSDSTTPNGGTLTSSNTNELYFAVGVDNDGNNTTVYPGSGYTLRHSTLDAMNNERFYAEDRISPAGSYATNFSINVTSAWAVIGASFKPEIVVPTSLPTATPKPTNTPIPLPTATPYSTATPTQFPTNTPIPQSTATPYPTYTPYPTLISATATPFPTSIPTPTPFVPTNTPMPTATPVPGNTTAKFTVFLHGVGKGGDSVNPNATGNLYPLHPQRDVTIDIYDVQNQLVSSQQGKATYNLGNGNFEGTIDLGNQFTTGIYTVKVKADHYLRTLFTGIQTITNGQTVTFPSATLVNGDANNDNQINIMDYNLLLGCYSDLLPATDCDDYRKVQTDLNDDGDVNQFDYNLFIRELTNIGGQ